MVDRYKCIYNKTQRTYLQHIYSMQDLENGVYDKTLSIRLNFGWHLA